MKGNNTTSAVPSGHVVVATERDMHNPGQHTAHYYSAASSASASSSSFLLLRDDARHGLLWQTLLAPRALVASVLHGLSATFLPVGYPQSVRHEYLTYQTWDTVQALCSYLRGILTTKAILEGSGVGSEAASALSAAMNWVFRDGVGMTCSLLFSSLASLSFDGNVKEWRLFADIANDAGLTLDMLTGLPCFKDHFLLLTCLATVCKAMCGVSAGCTKSSITAHFAIGGNIADVSAKENAQETAVTLAGILGGLVFAHWIASPAAAWPVFLFLTLLHVYANYKGVVALQLYTLNTQRTALLVQDFLATDNGKAPTTHLLTAAQIKEQERIWRPLWSWLRAHQPVMGCRVSDLGLSAPDLHFLRTKVYPREKYLLSFSPTTGRVLVLLHEGAQAQDELKAFFQAQALRHLYPDLGSVKHGGEALTKWPSPPLLKALLKSYELTVHRFPVFWAALERSKEEEGEEEGWELGRINLGTRGWRLLVEEGDGTTKKEK